MNVEEDFEIAQWKLGDFPSAKILLDQLFSDWLYSEGESFLSDFQTHLFSLKWDSNHPPPLSSPIDGKKSPKKRLQSEIQNKKNNQGPDFGSETRVSEIEPHTNGNDEFSDSLKSTTRRRANFDSIPIFYIPGQRVRKISQSSQDDLSQRASDIQMFFMSFPDGIPVDKFVHVTKRLCGLPSFYNLPLCIRIIDHCGDNNGSCGIPHRFGFRPITNKITLKMFTQYWKAEIEPFDRAERLFRTIKKKNADFIAQEDFMPFIQELLRFHPGLEFLSNHEDFQLKYALTVITRIFYSVNTSRCGKISLKELRKSNLFQAFMHVDEETDINKVTEYFSYEHFYILYCRFVELDCDKDGKIRKEDLMRYRELSLSDAIVERIFQVGFRAFSDGKEGGFEGTDGMTYPDFIYFMLSEEDKTTEISLRYWFNCGDIDCDGILSFDDMNHFYKSQLLRLSSLGHELVQFPDVLCQMLDMITPEDCDRITLEDILRPDKRLISGVLFDVLYNFQKFLRFETRDPFQEKIRREDGHACDWDRFAFYEYIRLAEEETGGDGDTERGDGGNGMDDDDDDSGLFLDDEDELVATQTLSSNSRNSGLSLKINISGNSSDEDNYSDDSDSEKHRRDGDRSWSWSLEDSDDTSDSSSRSHGNQKNNSRRR